MNKVELVEEKIGKGSITHLKIEGTDIKFIKNYSINKKDIDSLELTITIMIDPNKSTIKL